MRFVYLKEPSHRDGSFEHTHHTFWLRNRKEACMMIILENYLNHIYIKPNCVGFDKKLHSVASHKCPQSVCTHLVWEISAYMGIL